MGLYFSNSTSISSGLVADLWRYTASHQGNVYLGSSWERPDTNNQGYVGNTGMSQSNGKFAFPSTGIYFISFTAYMYIHNTTSKSQRCSCMIRTTTNNSSYSHAAINSCHFGGGGYNTSLNTDNSATTQLLFDVTDTSNCKVDFEFGAGQGFEYIGGNSSQNNTYAYFLKVGDT